MDSIENNNSKNISITETNKEGIFNLYTDGASKGNPGNSGCFAVIYDESQKNIIYKDGKLLGINTNNFAEYEGLITGLELALKHSIRKLHIFMDSQLVVKQIQGKYKIKDIKLKMKYNTVVNILKQFDFWDITDVPRAMNKEADKNVNILIKNGYNTIK